MKAWTITLAENIQQSPWGVDAEAKISWALTMAAMRIAKQHSLMIKFTSNIRFHNFLNMLPNLYITFQHLFLQPKKWFTSMKLSNWVLQLDKERSINLLYDFVKSILNFLVRISRAFNSSLQDTLLELSPFSSACSTNLVPEPHDNMRNYTLT